MALALTSKSAARNTVLEGAEADVLDGLQGLQVGGEADLKALTPEGGDTVLGVSLECSETLSLIDAALRLTPATSDDHAFIQRVKVALNNASALGGVLEEAVSDTKSGKCSWLNATAVEEIFGCAQQRLQAIDRASEALLYVLQQETEQVRTGEHRCHVEPSLRALAEAMCADCHAPPWPKRARGCAGVIWPKR